MPEYGLLAAFPPRDSGQQSAERVDAYKLLCSSLAVYYDMEGWLSTEHLEVQSITRMAPRGNHQYPRYHYALLVSPSQ